MSSVLICLNRVCLTRSSEIDVGNIDYPLSVMVNPRCDKQLTS